jgi:WW domain-binding protein 4
MLFKKFRVCDIATELLWPYFIFVSMGMLREFSYISCFVHLIKAKASSNMSTPYPSQQQKKKGGNEPWRNKDRHYCAVCNAWMGSDRQSILLHENGKKHREAVEADLKRRREDKVKKEKDESDLEKVFAKVNAAAAGGSSVVVGSSFGVKKPWELQNAPYGAISSTSLLVTGSSIPPNEQQPPKIQSRDVKPEKARSVFTMIPAEKKKEEVTLPDLNTGHYNIEGTTYLDGYTYATILEEGMPIQLWIGDPNALDGEKRDLRSFHYWKMALLAKVVRKRSSGSEQVTSCHVSYLLHSDDDDETLESNVSPSRIRLVLGSDPLLPSTLEEAHLALLGGEQTIQVLPEGNNTKQEIDENTGLSTWSTTAIRKVSSHYEQNQERKRKREHEKELAEYKEKKGKEIKARMMEEAKYANAHDSALGAYDVWSSVTSSVEGKTAAYKGVDIHKEIKVEVADTAKSLSKGMGNVAFKKTKVKKKSIRRTSADDE